MSRNQQPSSFTLIELLVVVAIIGILMAILLPTLQMAKEKAMEITCVNVLKQHGLVVFFYIDDCNEHLPGALTDSNGDGIPDPTTTSEWEYIFSHKFLQGMCMADYYNLNISQDCHSTDYNSTIKTKVQNYICPKYLKLYSGGNLVYYEAPGGQYKENPYRRGYRHSFGTSADTNEDGNSGDFGPFRGAPGWRKMSEIGSMNWPASDLSPWQKTWSKISPPEKLVLIYDYKFVRGNTDQVITYNRGNGHRYGYGYLTCDGSAHFAPTFNAMAGGWNSRPGNVIPKGWAH